MSAENKRALSSLLWELFGMVQNETWCIYDLREGFDTLNLMTGLGGGWCGSADSDGGRAWLFNH